MGPLSGAEPPSSRHRMAGIATLFVCILGLMIAGLLAGGLVSRDDIAGGLQGQDPVLADASMDQWTLCGLLIQGTATEPGASPLTNALMNYSDQPIGPDGPCRLVSELRAGALPRSEHPEPYFRYWFGTAALMRVGIAVVGFAGVLNLFFIAAIIALMLLAVSLARATSVAVAIGTLLPLALGTDFANVMRSPAENLQWVVTWSAGALLCSARGWRLGTRAAVVAASAALVNYFDLLRTPVAFALMLVGPILVVMVWDRARPLVLLRSAAVVAAAWFTGYAGAWVVKWALVAATVPGADVLNQIRGQLAYRSEGVVDGTSTSVAHAISRNVRTFWDQGLAPVVLTILAVALVTLGVSAYRRHSWIPVLAFIATAWIGVLPFVWYALVKNHSIIHNWMTFRSIAAAVAVLSGLALAAVGPPRSALPLARARRLLGRLLA